MSASRSESIAAFEMLYLDPLPTVSSIRGAANELRTLTVEQFSTTAIEALSNSGPEPRSISICERRRKLRKNVGSAKHRAWHFDVYVDSGRAIKRMDFWLSDDGVWATSVGGQVATPVRMTEPERSELTDEYRIGRASRSDLARQSTW